MQLQFSPTWGPPTLFRLGTARTYPVTFTPAGPACRPAFSRELMCELRLFVYKPAGARVAGQLRAAGAGQALLLLLLLLLLLRKEVVRSCLT